MAGTARGFTWVEVCVIIVILMAAVTFVLPLFLHSRPYHPKRESCSNNQRQIAVAIQIYAQDNDEALPSADKVWSAVKMAPAAFICLTKGKSTPNAYVYNVNLSGAALGAFSDPTNEMMIMDGRNTGGWFDKHTGTLAPNGNDGPAANALLCPKDSHPLSNVFYAPGDQDPRHGGIFICAYLDGHVGGRTVTPEADVDWGRAGCADANFSANMTPTYAPKLASTLSAPAGSKNTQTAPGGYGMGYSYTQPHLGSSISINKPGKQPGWACSKLGLVQGKVSWRFNNPNTNVPITVGFGGNGLGTAVCASLNSLYYAVQGCNGSATFYQRNDTRGYAHAGEERYFVPRGVSGATTPMGEVEGSTAVTYVCTDVFTIERAGQIVNFKVNGKVVCSTSDTGKSPLTKTMTIPNAMMKMWIYVYCGDYKKGPAFVTPNTAPVANLGITNMMATGLQ